MGDPRWTDETKMLVRRHIASAAAAIADAAGTDSPYDISIERAKRLLDALADRGLLVEPGGETRTVYAVTSGDYDWWSLDGVFDRQDDAIAAVNAGFGQEVEERQLYPAGNVPERIDYWEASAEVTAQGSPKTMDHSGGPGTGSIWVRSAIEWTGSRFDPPDPPRVRLSTTHMGGTFISVQAMTEAAARQACSDAVDALASAILHTDQPEDAKP